MRYWLTNLVIQLIKHHPLIISSSFFSFHLIILFSSPGQAISTIKISFFSRSSYLKSGLAVKYILIRCSQSHLFPIVSDYASFSPSLLTIYSFYTIYSFFPHSIATIFNALSCFRTCSVETNFFTSCQKVLYCFFSLFAQFSIIIITTTKLSFSRKSL